MTGLAECKQQALFFFPLPAPGTHQSVCQGPCLLENSLRGSAVRPTQQLPLNTHCPGRHSQLPPSHTTHPPPRPPPARLKSTDHPAKWFDLATMTHGNKCKHLSPPSQRTETFGVAAPPLVPQVLIINLRSESSPSPLIPAQTAAVLNNDHRVGSIDKPRVAFNEKENF